MERRISAEIEDERYQDNKGFIERLENTSGDETMNYLNERRGLIQAREQEMIGGGYNEKYIYDNYCRELKKQKN